MKVLVTGGDGFIGRHLVQSLLDRGDAVEILDNNITSVPELSHENLNRTIGDVSELNEITEFSELDVIVHLASVAIPKMYMENRDLVISPNVFGTNEVCKLAETFGARLIFASTSEVYGSISDDSPIGTPIHESESSLHSLLNTRSPYSNAKKMGEELVSTYVQKGNSGCSVRFFNVVGPKMDYSVLSYGRVFPNFLDAINDSRPLEIFGTGEQTRSFLWIDDAISALLKLIDYDGDLPLAINIGNPEPVTINSLAEKFQEISNEYVGVEYLPELPHEPRHRCPDISLASSLLDWKPTISLDEIIQLVVDDQTMSAAEENAGVPPGIFDDNGNLIVADKSWMDGTFEGADPHIVEIPNWVRKGGNMNDHGIWLELGYSAAKDGPGVNLRRRSLINIYTAKFEGGGHSDERYLQQFGEPMSEKRWLKIRRYLSSQINYNKNKSWMNSAVKKWSDDRDWFLRYVGERHGFEEEGL